MDGRVKIQGGSNEMLDAAEEIVRSGGLEKLTIGTLATTLGVSKAGVLHHFKTKRALLKSLMQRDYDRFTASLDRHRAAASAETGMSVKQQEFHAYFHAVLEDAKDGDFLRLSLSLAALVDPSLIENNITELKDRWSKADACDLDDVDFVAARLVADGLWINIILGVAPHDNLIDDLYAKLISEFRKRE